MERQALIKMLVDELEGLTDRELTGKASTLLGVSVGVNKDGEFEVGSIDSPPPCGLCGRPRDKGHWMYHVDWI